MSRAENYHEQRAKQLTLSDVAEPTQPQTLQRSVDIGIEKSKEKAYDNYIQENANRSVASRLPYELNNAVFDMPDERTWTNMSFWDKQKYMYKQSAKTTWNMLKEFPATVAKAPLKITHSILEGESRVLEHYFGKNSFSLPPSYNLPVLGEVRGFGGSYDEGRELGLSPFMSSVKATGEFAGDVAISFSLVDAVNSVFRPRIATVQEGVVGKDFRPLQAKEAQQIQVKAGEGKIQGPQVFESKQNPDISYFKMSKEAAGKYKGKPSNTYLKVSPMGDGQAEFSVIQVRGSLAEKGKDFLANKFGRSKVTEGEFGPEIKLESGIMDYEPGAGMQKQQTTLPTTTTKQSTPSEIIIRLKEKEALFAQQAKQPKVAIVDKPTQGALATGGIFPAEVAPTDVSGVPPKVVTETKAIMKKPIKGFSDKMSTQKQVAQVENLAFEMEIDDMTVQVISRSITGKKNINDLNQKELFDVSETVRGFTKNEVSSPDDFNPINRSFTHPARYWMEAAEREFQSPVYSEVYLPMEQSIRLTKVFNDRWQDSARDAFGKYADPKFVEERRMLTEYTEGNKSAITQNDALSATTKQELIKIGDWLVESYKGFFKDSGIKSDRFFSVYSPRIRKSAGIKNLFKSNQLPPELKTFIEFEREGMLDPLEDDALALFDVYTRAFSRKKFVQGPFANAQKVIANAPKNISKAANSYLQEKMGYQDALAETTQKFSKTLSQKTNGLIPENVFEQMNDFAMTTSYSGALGLPRIMPVLRNMVQPLLTTYPELGAQFFSEGVNKFMSPEGLKEIQEKGFLVNMKQPFGAELSDETGRGYIGRAADKYKQLNKAAMKPYASIDTLNRGVTYHGVQARFDAFWSKFRKGEISYQEFEEGINMDGFSPTLQKVVRNKLALNTEESLTEATDMMTADILDRTQFPYRKGSQSRLHYGLGGKLGLQFAQWGWEYAFTLKSWMARGQYDKVLRWLGMGTAIKRTAEDMAGVDVSKWVLGGPFSGFPVGPIGKMGASLIAGTNAAFSGMTEDVNKHWKDIANSVKIYGGTLTGVGTQRVKKFLDSVKRFEAGIAVSTDPNPENKFGVWSSTGKLLRWTDMSGLMKNLFGFDEIEKEEFSNRINRIKKESTEHNMKVSDAMNSLVDGNFEEFNKIVTENNLQINDIAQKLKSYNIPLDQRIFERMPLELKIKYFGAFYPQ